DRGAPAPRNQLQTDRSVGNCRETLNFGETMLSKSIEKVRVHGFRAPYGVSFLGDCEPDWRQLRLEPAERHAGVSPFASSERRLQLEIPHNEPSHRLSRLIRSGSQQTIFQLHPSRAPVPSPARAS